MQGLVALACLVLGLVVGLSSVALHQRWWGMALGIAATSATAVALPPGWGARIPFSAGWAAMAGYLAIPRGEGDYVIDSDLSGYLLLGFGLALAVAALVTWPPRRPPRMRR